jgi:hypothetical protein
MKLRSEGNSYWATGDSKPQDCRNYKLHLVKKCGDIYVHKDSVQALLLFLAELILSAILVTSDYTQCLIKGSKHNFGEPIFHTGQCIS